MADVWMNSLSAAPNLLSHSPTSAKLLPARNRFIYHIDLISNLLLLSALMAPESAVSLLIVQSILMPCYRQGPESAPPYLLLMPVQYTVCAWITTLYHNYFELLINLCWTPTVYSIKPQQNSNTLIYQFHMPVYIRKSSQLHKHIFWPLMERGQRII